MALKLLGFFASALLGWYRRMASGSRRIIACSPDCATRNPETMVPLTAGP
jgi:hypothetical protein